MTLRTIILGFAVVFMASHVAGQEVLEGKTVRLSYRPVLLFNQHLYRGLMSRPSAVAYDREQNEIWVAEADGGVIGVYRHDGAELFSFTVGGESGRIAVTPEGDVAVFAGGRPEPVTLFSYRGEPKGSVQLDGIGEKPIVVDLEFDRAGNMYVAERASSRILVYRPSGELRLQFGSHGVDEGQFSAIVGLAVGQDGRVYVADARGVAVQVFDEQGNFLRGWGNHAAGEANFSLPAGIAVDSKDRVIVVDQLRHSIKVFDGDGSLLSNFGGFGEAIGQLAFPSDVAVDEEDRIIVTDRMNSRVQVFEIAGSPR